MPIVPWQTRYFFLCGYEYDEFIVLVRREKNTPEVRSSEIKNSPRDCFSPITPH